MKIAGVICEYNPFHRGHAYHLAETRADGLRLYRRLHDGQLCSARRSGVPFQMDARGNGASLGRGRGI